MGQKFPNGYHENYNQCFFSLNNKKGEIISKWEPYVCFAPIMSSGNIDLNTHYILVYPKINECAYEPDDIIKYIHHINLMGFPCTFNGKSNLKGHYEFKIPVRNRRGKLVYKSKDHICSTLNMISYLYERSFKELIFVYFNILDQVGKGCNKFLAFQMAHQIISGSGHALKSETKQQTVLRRKELFNRFKQDGESIFRGDITNIHDKWRTKQLKMVYTGDWKEDYYKIKNNIMEKTKVFVVGPAVNYANWLPNHKLVNKLEEAELVLFTGGEDVHPALYHEEVGPRTGTNIHRDIIETQIFAQAKRLNKKLLGICRGSQFLCVMAGGRLVQDQSNPKAIHAIKVLKMGTQNIWKPEELEINITSTHHQAAYPFNIPSHNYKIWGWTIGISPHHTDGASIEMAPVKECEIVRYNNINALGIQGHPEFDSFQNNPENAGSMEYLKNLITQFLENKI